MSYFLTFSMQFDREPGLDNGRLRLCNLTEGKVEIWIATSSVASRQKAEDFHQRGGLIPPEYRVPGLKFWTVSTKPIPMPNNPGVAGNFYQISPFEVITDRGGKRGDFGIHLDGNVPGSLGCIVMSKDRFVVFEEMMKRLLSEKVNTLPLFVTYS